MAKKKQQLYTSEDISVLDDLTHIRLRKNMYIGETEDPRQLLSEIFDNALDEIQAGYSDKVIVNIDTDKNEYVVRDFGRGIPHGKKKLDSGEEKEVLEILLTKSNSGGKFDNSNYLTSAGMHGLGITITNALSNYIEITSFRDGKYVKATAHSDINVELEYGNTNEPNGTIVKFQPNASMFHNKSIPKSFMLNRCNIASALGYTAILIIDGETIPIHSSIFDLIQEENNQISTYVDIPPFDIVSDNKERLKVALRYTSDVVDKSWGFTNLLSNYLGGTHVTELSKTISLAWKEFIDEHKKLKPLLDLKNSDYLLGLRSVCAAFILSPEFSSQTKEKLVVNKKYFENLMGLFKNQFKKYLVDNIDLANNLIKRFEEYRFSQNVLLSRKEISSIIKVNTDSGDNIRRRSVVSKLIECTSKKRDNTELFLVEGDSACLRWDTLIRLANDTEDTIKSVCERVARGENVYVYGKSPRGTPDNGPNVYRVISGGITRKNAPLYRVYIDNGTYVDCTYDHKFMLTDRSFKEALQLSTEDMLSTLTLDEIQLINSGAKLTEENGKSQICRILKMEPLGICEDVYDIEVEDVHNFCLANDVIVHNCGPFKSVRNRETQAVLALRGKILNITNKSIKDAIKNNEICDIANSIGAGIGSACDASKSRYDRIIIAADADPDGQQITCLLLSMFVNLFPDLIKQGRVFVAHSPLYCWKDSNGKFGGCDLITEIPSKISVYERIKGLGELNNDQLEYFLVNPKTRNLFQVEFPSNVDEFNRIMGTSAGKHDLFKDLGILE